MTVNSGECEMNSCIYIVEDDEAVRDSLALLLESEGLQVETFATGDAFLDAWNPEMAGCLVLDIRMPGSDGLDVQRILNERGSLLPIIFVTGHGDVPLAVDAMKHGAVDFVQKPYREEELLDKIKAALAEDSQHRDSLRERHEILERIESLTPREREVMDRIVNGEANKVIAAELGISQRTVEIHRSRVLHKMGTHSVAPLVRMVLAARDETGPVG